MSFAWTQPSAVQNGWFHVHRTVAPSAVLMSYHSLHGVSLVAETLRGVPVPDITVSPGRMLSIGARSPDANSTIVPDGKHVLPSSVETHSYRGVRSLLASHVASFA